MDLDVRARHLVSLLRSGVSGISASVFDTAWMSLILKPATPSEEKQWLFPSCLQFILSTQLKDGSWPAYSTPEDGIVNTAAALIALTFHTELDLTSQRNRARESLQKILETRNTEGIFHSDYAPLIRSLLNVLFFQRISFSPLAIGAEIYSGGNGDILLNFPEHFLERLDSDANFVCPGFAPGLLAAVTTFKPMLTDHRLALLHKINTIADHGVPALYPGTLFEISSIVPLFIDHDLGDSATIDEMSIETEQGLSAQGVSLDSSGLAFEADCHLNMMLALEMGGSGTEKAKSVILTKQGSPCLLLRLMLHVDDPQRHQDRIESLCLQICEESWSDDRLASTDKNWSPYYSTMLMANAFLDLIRALEDHRIAGSLRNIIRDRVLVVLFQRLFAIVHGQNQDGSWGDRHCVEETSYALLAIMCISRLPMAGPLAGSITKTCQRGKDFLRRKYMQSGHKQPSYLWKGRVSFSSSLVAEAFTLAALKAEFRPMRSIGLLAETVNIPFDRLPALEDFYASLPAFKDAPRSIILTSLIEGYLLWPTLCGPEFVLYQDKDSSRWLEYITFVFPACNNLYEVFAPTKILVALMGIMSGLYQIDSFMEHAIEKGLVSDAGELFLIIDDVFGDSSNGPSPGTTNPAQNVRHKRKARIAATENKDTPPPQHGLHSPPRTPRDSLDSQTSLQETSADSLTEARTTLQTLVTSVTHHPAVLQASAHDRHWLWSELHAFFYAQASQIEEITLFAEQRELNNSTATDSRRARFDSPFSTYYRWLHTTGADSVGSPYQFAFFSILLAAPRGPSASDATRPAPAPDCWPSPREKHLAQSLSAGVARMWRAENDAGGIARDRADGTVNSVDFAEFGGVAGGDAGLRRELVALAERERRGWRADWEELRRLAGGDRVQEERVRLVRLFTGAMELYGQIYIARDVWWKKADD